MNLLFVEKRSNWPIEKTPVLCCGADCLLTTLDGADFRTSYNWQTGWGDWHASCAGTREFRRLNIPGAGAPLVNLTANDPDLKQVAERKHATPAQIALAWLLAQKPWIVPIPGTTKRERLEENLGAVDLDLTPDDLREINAAAAKIEVRGARLPMARPAPKADLRTRQVTMGAQDSYYDAHGASVPIPFLRLRGKWLERGGFPIGVSLRITVEMGRLVIEPAPELVTETASVGTRKPIIERFKAS